jgi:hypothetical protein
VIHSTEQALSLNRSVVGHAESALLVAQAAEAVVQLAHHALRPVGRGAHLPRADGALSLGRACLAVADGAGQAAGADQGEGGEAGGAHVTAVADLAVDCAAGLAESGAVGGLELALGAGQDRRG